MFGSTASKVVASVVLVASASGTASLPVKPEQSASREIPVALDDRSLLVATLANGDLQTQWMSRDVCERIEASVISGDAVAGVRADGVKVYIARANCCTPRVAVPSNVTALSAAVERNGHLGN
ncbi:hypothetical protein [Hyphomicrobium sp.]|uniref:hypothetical protein n=1 Tax=Hyphomicrobium sp. TaxID=82 RepID=UPI001D7D96A5|nr:hypothetical protein [Hyphomicrobium sp.]MBY0559168.1 hypothetical protein [Hyphomicrobium sp.]